MFETEVLVSHLVLLSFRGDADFCRGHVAVLMKPNRCGISEACMRGLWTLRMQEAIGYHLSERG